MLRMRTILLVPLFLTLGAACSENGTEPAQQPDRVEVIASDTTLGVGQTAQLEAVVLDASGNPLHIEITWNSSDPAVVQVSANGHVEAVSEGQARVTARIEGSNNGPSSATLFDVRGTVSTIELAPNLPPSVRDRIATVYSPIDSTGLGSGRPLETRTQPDSVYGAIVMAADTEGNLLLFGRAYEGGAARIGSAETVLVVASWFFRPPFASVENRHDLTQLEQAARDHPRFEPLVAEVTARAAEGTPFFDDPAILNSVGNLIVDVLDVVPAADAAASDLMTDSYTTPASPLPVVVGDDQASLDFLLTNQGFLQYHALAESLAAGYEESVVLEARQGRLAPPIEHRLSGIEGPMQLHIGHNDATNQYRLNRAITFTGDALLYAFLPILNVRRISYYVLVAPPWGVTGPARILASVSAMLASGFGKWIFCAIGYPFIRTTGLTHAAGPTVRSLVEWFTVGGPEPCQGVVVKMLRKIRGASLFTKVILGSLAGPILFVGLSWFLNDPVSWLDVVVSAVVTGAAVLVLVPRDARGAAAESNDA